jgi:hypothetical protein
MEYPNGSIRTNLVLRTPHDQSSPQTNGVRIDRNLVNVPDLLRVMGTITPIHSISDNRDLIQDPNPTIDIVMDMTDKEALVGDVHRHETDTII